MPRTRSSRRIENADTAITVVRDLSKYVEKVATVGPSRPNDQQQKAAFDGALKSYERLLVNYPEDVDVRANLGGFTLRANLSRLLVETADAEEFYRKASKHFDELATSNPNNTSYRQDSRGPLETLDCCS